MQEAHECHRNRMHRVAERNDTEVYDYVYDEQRHQATPEVCVNLAKRTIEARQELSSSLSSIDAGRLICQKDPILRDFSENFPKIFSYMLDAERCGDKLEMLEKMARIQKEVIERNLSEAEAKVHVSRIVMEKTMREPTEEEKQQHNL